MLGGILAILIGAFSGSGVVPSLTKVGVHFSAPLVFVFFRFLFATIIFSPFVIFSSKTKFFKKDYSRLLVLAFFLFVNVTFFTIGVSLTTVLMSQLLYLPTPIVVSILGHFFLHEKLNMHKIIGLIIALGGILFLLYQSIAKQSVFTFGTPLGNAIILIAMLGYSSWLLYSRHLSKKHTYSSYQTTFFTFLFITVYLLVLIPFQGSLVPSKISFIMPHGVFLAIFVALAYAIQYFFLHIGIKKTSAFTASIFQYVGPVFAGVISVPLLHEKLSTAFLIGGIVIMLGVFYATTFDYLANRKKKSLEMLQ